MPHRCTMKLTKYLICTVLLAVYVQSIEAKNLENGTIEKNLCPNNALATADLRGIKDVWGKLREGAIVTWNYIKSVGEYTKANIKKFVNNLIQYAKDLKDEFLEKIQELKNKVYNIISDIYGTGEFVRLCLSKEKENMEHILKELMGNMGQCIAEEINHLGSLSVEAPELAMNQSMFIRYLDTKKEQCENDVENIQECLCKARAEIFDNFTGMEGEILQTHFEARSITDDIKETLVTCSISNLIDATTLISSEIVQIAQCVIEEREHQLPDNNY